MEEKLRAHMEELFRDVPDSEQAREIKEEILQNIIDKYHDLLAEGKSEEAACNIAIEGIGDLSELLDSLKQGKAAGQGSEFGKTHASTRAYDAEYGEWKKKSAVRTAIAVMLYILCVIPPIIADGMGAGDTVGPCLMFFMVAVATAILVFNNMSKPSYKRNGDTVADEFMEWKSKNHARKQSWNSVYSALWSIILVLYFVISFTTMAWHVTWVIFLVGAAVQSVLRAVAVNTDGPGSSRAVQITCGIIAGVAFLFLVFFFLFRVFSGGDFSLAGFQLMGGSHYANAEKFTAGPVSIQPDKGIDNPLSEIQIDWIDGTVELTGVEGLKEIKIEEEGSADRKKGDQVHSYYHNGILEIRYQESGFHLFKMRDTNKHLKVQVPAELAANIQEINGDFVSTDVTARDLQTDVFEADTVSGQIAFYGMIRKEIDIDSVSGDTVLNLADAPESVSADSVSGDFILTLPRSSSFEVELDTVSGDIECELPITSSKEEDGDYEYIRCGDGKNSFDFDTVSGDVEIKAAG